MKNNSALQHKLKLSLLCLVTILFAAPAWAAMENYCATPAFLGQNIAPNVMVVLDNSGSMCDAAYSGSYNPSQFEAGVYYGYFDGNTNYRYNGSKWVPTTAAMSTATLANPIAKGSFLNWATMRRIDVAKKVLIGGKATPRTYEGSTPVTLYGEPCVNPGSSVFQKTGRHSADLIQPGTYQGSCTFSMTGASNALTIKCGTTSRAFNTVVDQGETNARGVIDALASQVRFGLAFYNSEEGGKIVNYNRYNAATDMVASIHDLAPSTWTPLAETLYEVVRYFRQDDPFYVKGTSPGNPGDFFPGSGNFTGENIFRDPYAYKFTDIDPTLDNQYVRCAQSFVLFLTDGESTKDQNIPRELRGYSRNGGPAGTIRYGGTPIGQTYGYGTGANDGTDYMIDIAYWARTVDMRPGSETDTPTAWRKSLPGSQNIVLYPVFMFGSGSTFLKDAAIYGGFLDIKDKNGNTNNKPDCNVRPAECYRDSNGDGLVKADGSDLPRTYYESSDGYTLERDLKKAIQEMLARATSGTAASMLGSSQGSGASILQSLFYPKRNFGFASEVTWISDLMNYWYYLDPALKNMQIREDSVRDNADYSLFDLRNDRIVSFGFDEELNTTMANLCLDENGNGTCDPGETRSRNPIEDTRPLWRAGQSLWWTTADSRRIWTTINGNELTTFAESNSEALDDYMGLSANAAGSKAIIEYVRGKDQIGTTSRLCSINRNPCTSDADCTEAAAGEVCEETRNRTVTQEICSVSKTPCSSTPTDTCGKGNGVCQRITETWKLGDVVSSTPRILGPSPLNSYNVKPPRGYSDKTYNKFVKGPEYAERGQVLVGANDGMLHAFKLGKIAQKWDTQQYHQVAILEGKQGERGIGSENWAYVPKNALPYLQYLSKPDYCHVYMVDGPVFLADVSIQAADGQTDYWNGAKTERSWRTVAIGSMGIGGATSGTAGGSCVQIPLKMADGASVGWSSYFALDVTDQDNPALLWEFPNTKSGDPDPGLGVSNIGPTIVKVGGKEKRCSDTNAVCSQNSDCGGSGAECAPSNGRWFAILASGSTGPINKAGKSFQGTSSQNLKLFVLDLKTGELVRTIDTGITNAFAGSMGSNAIDLEKNNLGSPGNYQDDVVYIGYVQDTTKGGVARLVIDDDPDPANWTVSKVIDNIGPVTTSVANLLDRRSGDLWLFFAEGRFFYPKDDLSSVRRFYGIKDPCYTRASGITQDCTAFSTYANLKDQSSNPERLPADRTGWFITMDQATPLAGAERVITNPTPDPSGAVYFLSFTPTTDICGLGGTTYLWSVDYKSGMSVTYLRQGTALVQVSTGEVKELDLSDSQTFPNKGNRRSEGFLGIPPAGQGLVIVTTPLPVKEFMNVQEQ